MLAGSHAVGLVGSGDPYWVPRGLANAWGPAVAEDSRQMVESEALSPTFRCFSPTEPASGEA